MLFHNDLVVSGTVSCQKSLFSRPLMCGYSHSTANFLLVSKYFSAMQRNWEVTLLHQDRSGFILKNTAATEISNFLVHLSNIGHIHNLEVKIQTFGIWVTFVFHWFAPLTSNMPRKQEETGRLPALTLKMLLKSQIAAVAFGLFWKELSTFYLFLLELSIFH